MALRLKYTKANLGIVKAAHKEPTRYAMHGVLIAESGALLATNGKILCRLKAPFLLHEGGELEPVYEGGKEATARVLSLGAVKEIRKLASSGHVILDAVPTMQNSKEEVSSRRTCSATDRFSETHAEFAGKCKRLSRNSGFYCPVCHPADVTSEAGICHSKKLTQVPFLRHVPGHFPDVEDIVKDKETRHSRADMEFPTSVLQEYFGCFKQFEAVRVDFGVNLPSIHAYMGRNRSSMTSCFTAEATLGLEGDDDKPVTSWVDPGLLLVLLKIAQENGVETLRIRAVDYKSPILLTGKSTTQKGLDYFGLCMPLRL